MFEMSHVWIFAIAIMYVINSSLVILSSNRIIRKWFHLQSEDVQEVITKIEKEEAEHDSDEEQGQIKIKAAGDRPWYQKYIVGRCDVYIILSS
jgi:hypothetical protein